MAFPFYRHFLRIILKTRHLKTELVWQRKESAESHKVGSTEGCGSSREVLARTREIFSTESDKCLHPGRSHLLPARPLSLPKPSRTTEPLGLVVEKERPEKKRRKLSQSSRPTNLPHPTCTFIPNG